MLVSFKFERRLQLTALRMTTAQALISLTFEDYDDIEILGDLYRKTKNYRFRSNLFTCLTLTLTL